MKCVQAILLLGITALFGRLNAQTPCPPSAHQAAELPDAKGILISIDGGYRIPISSAWTSGKALHGPWNLDECGDGFDNYNKAGFALYWMVLPGVHQEEAIEATRKHLLPKWLNLPIWDSGEESTARIAEWQVTRFKRTNGIPFEEVDIVGIDNGVVVCHFIGYPHPSPPQDFSPFLDEMVRTVGTTLHLKASSHEPAPWRSAAQKVPATLPECFSYLNRYMSPDEKKVLEAESEERLIDWDEGIGPREHEPWIPWIQRYWGLNDGGSPLSKYLDKFGLHSSGQQSYAIFMAYRKHLRSEKINIRTVSSSILKNEKKQVVPR